MSESNRYKDALRRLKDDLKKPHPLRILGLSPEVVQALNSEEALKLAARGMFRALNYVYHPDQSRVKTDSTQKLVDLREALQVVEQNPLGARRTFLEESKAKKPKSKAVVERIRYDSVIDIAKTAVRQMVDGFYSPESVQRIHSGSILLYTPNTEGLVYGGLSVSDGGRAVYQPMEIFDRLRPNHSQFKSIVRAAGLTESEGNYSIHSSDNGIIVIGKDNESNLVKRKSNILPQGSWFRLSGSINNGKDERCLEQFNNIGSSEEVTLLGTIPMETFEYIRSNIARLDGSSGSGTPTLDIPAGAETYPTSMYGIYISETMWDSLISGNRAGEMHTFVPLLVPGDSVVVENSFGRRFTLGKILQQSVEFN